LEGHLLDPAVYSAEQVGAKKAALVRLWNYDDPCLDEALYDDLSDRVVEYFRFYGSRRHTNNPNLHR
jgi:hypothetical protein